MNKSIKKINKFNLDAYNRPSNKFLIGGMMSGIGSAAGAITDVMANGNSTGVGNAMKSIGSAASAIPGVGGLIGAGVNVLGGVVNTLFGSNINEAAVSKLDNQAQQTGGIQVNATSNEDLLNQMSSSQQMNSISKKDIGTEGWLSNAATDKAAEINANIALNNKRQSQAFNIGAENISDTQNANAMRNFKALGGTLGANFTNGITSINNGGTHEQNPNQGVAISKDGQGTPNMVEEGELIFKDYVFSNRLKVPKNVKNKFKMKGDSFANIVNNLQKESEERPNDPISKKGLEDNIKRLIPIQEGIREKRKQKEMTNLMNKLSPKELQLLQEQQAAQPQQEQMQVNPNKFVNGGGTKLNFDTNYTEMPYGDPVNYAESRLTDFKNNEAFIDIEYKPKLSNLKLDLPNSGITKDFNKEESQYKLDVPTPNLTPKSDPISGAKNKKKSFLDSALSDLRYAPIAGSLANTITDALGVTNKPDYSSVNAIGAAMQNVKKPDYKPVSNYLAYKPMDTDYYTNKLNADASATRSAITNNSGGNRGNAMAGIIAADYNYGNSLGALARQGEEYNSAQRERVEGFNRDTNIANSSMDLKAQSMEQQNNQLLLNSTLAQGQLRDQINSRSDMAKSANLTNLFDSIGDVGREEFSKNMINSNNSQYYGIDRSGNTYYKDAYNVLSPEEKSKVDNIIGIKSKKNGGYLMTKSRKNGI